MKIGLIVFCLFTAEVHAQSSLTGTATQQTQALQSGATMNMMIGTMLMSSCMSAKKPDMMICLLGGMALMQGIQQNQAAQAANTTATTAAMQIALSNPYTVLAPAALPTTYRPPATVSSGLAALSAAGYKVTSTGVTLPGGKFVPASTLASPDALKQLGFSEADITRANKLTTSIAKNTKN